MIHVGWAFEKDEKLKRDENRKEYENILLKNNFEILDKKSEYHRLEFNIKADKSFTAAEMLLFADEGNLCFGGGVDSVRDNYKQLLPGVYRCHVFTD